MLNRLLLNLCVRSNTTDIEISVAELTVVSPIQKLLVANEDQSLMVVHSIIFSVTFPLTILI